MIVLVSEKTYQFRAKCSAVRGKENVVPDGIFKVKKLFSNLAMTHFSNIDVMCKSAR